MTPPLKRIVWALDASQETDATQKNAIKTLEVLARQSGSKIEIEPCYVIPAPYIVPADIIPPQPIDLTDEALELMELKVKNVKLPGLLGPRVLYEPVYTNTQTARVLIKYAQDSNTDLIVVGTRSKRGLVRLFVGSFAESLIMHSTVPVLTVNASTQPPRKFCEILFPTDFEKESRAVFSSVVDFARDFGARLTLYHMVIRPFFTSPGMALTSEQRDYLAVDRAYAEQRAQAFLDEAARAAVAAKLHISVSRDSVSNAIIRFARKGKFNLIAMAARSGRTASLLTGSATRQVVRSSPVSVWVLREPKAAGERRRAAA